MYILSISALYHDSATALVGDGEILVAVSEGCFPRIKIVYLVMRLVGRDNM